MELHWELNVAQTEGGGKIYKWMMSLINKHLT